MTFWRRIRGADNRTGHLLAWVGLGILLVWLLPDALEWLRQAVDRALPPQAIQAPPTVPQPQVDEPESGIAAKSEGGEEQATPPPQTMGEEHMDDGDEDEDELETATPPPDESTDSPAPNPVK